MTGHVTIVEDHGLIAHTVATGLRAHRLHVEVVDTTRTDDVVVAAATSGTDLVLLDLDLGATGDATGLIDPLRELGAEVVMLTGVDDPIRHARCVAAGALGVLGKHIGFEQLLAAVRRVLAGDGLLSRHERDELLRQLREHDREQQRRLAPFEALTTREAEVLGELMRGRTVEQIARASVVSVATVRTQVRAIRTKLGVSSQVAAIGRALQAGWQPPDGNVGGRREQST